MPTLPATNFSPSSNLNCNIFVIASLIAAEKGFSKLNKDGIKLSHFPMIKTKPVEQEINLFFFLILIIEKILLIFE